jgi:hypothetical protein
MLLTHPNIGRIERAPSNPSVHSARGQTDAGDSLRVVDLIEVRSSPSIQGHVHHDVDVTAQEHILSHSPIGAGNESGDRDVIHELLGRRCRGEARATGTGGRRRVFPATEGREREGRAGAVGAPCFI